MLRQKVADILFTKALKDQKGEFTSSLEYAQSIVNLFKAEVDKMTVIDDEEIMSHAKDEVQHTFGWTREVILSGARVVAQAQLKHTKKQLLDIMGE